MADTTGAPEQSDEILAQHVLSNEHAFGELIDRYQAKLLRYIKRIAGVSDADAEDICQDVFIKVYRNIRGFDPSLSFSSWIYRIAHNETRSYYRKHKKREQTYSLDAESYDHLAGDLETDGLTITREREGMLEQALAQMKEAYREVLVLHFLEQKSYAEISDILRKPTGSVGTLIHRAKKQLRVLLEKEEGIDEAV